MAGSPARPLPSRRNHLAVEDQTPPCKYPPFISFNEHLSALVKRSATNIRDRKVELLVERRRLGQTALSVKPGQVGTSNATKAGNLGVFDYVHLRVPLPKNLKGSEVFQAGRSTPVPEAYFLMRRCSDGFISATGMFKATFPWATKVEEEREKDHIRSFPATDSEEVAGNLWVAPTFALELATDYGIWDWIAALLDNETVELDPKDARKDISHPPNFAMPPKSSANGTGTASARKRTVSRDLRSASPVKSTMPAPPSPVRAKATPRKPRTKKDKATKDPKTTSPLTDSVAESSDDIDAAAKPVVSAAAVAKAAKVTAAPEPLADGSVRVSVTSDTIPGADSTETTRTTVKVELPADSPDLKLPKDTEGVVAVAKDIVESAKELQDAPVGAAPKATPSKKSLKRKADVVEDDTPNSPEEIVQEIAEGETSDLVAANGEVQLRPAKRTRVMVAAEEYRREKVKRRALMGLSGALAVGVMIPFLSNLL